MQSGRTNLSKVLLGRMIAELFLLVTVFVAFDQLTAPSKDTATAVMEAVKKQQLEPICIVEVRSAIRSAGFFGVVLAMFGICAFVLLCSDIWLLWRSRQEAQQSHSPK